jgi:cytochrome c biogenesis protein CcmG/thiol:disulfide interchange protein DsbE
VDDVLVARPRDFGFYGRGEGSGEGRYTPLRSAASHERFRGDLTRMIELILAGRKAEARAEGVTAEADEVRKLPAFTLTDLEGRPVEREELAGRAVLVEFWATWCPPCRSTLGWLGELKKRYGDDLVVLAVAIESDEAEVRKVAKATDAPLRWAMGTPELARAFGDVSAVPTLLLYDRDGRSAAAFYGAPPTLHGEAESKLAALLRR